jgi:hypothetical protein
MNNMGREIMAALKRFQTGSDGDGVTVGGSLVVSGSTTVNTFNVDVISEKTSAAGVTIDGVLLKDNGVVTGAGTVSAPVYSTTGDTNTGIFFPAADTIAFTEGGAEAMRIDSSGNVGIGTTSPGNALSISRSITNTPLINLINTNTASSHFGIQWTSSGSDAATRNWAVSVDQAAFGDFAIRQSNAQAGNPFTAGTTRLYISNSGNVGIGTTTTSGAVLNIANGSQDELVFRGTGFTTVISESTSGMDIKLSQSAPMSFYTNNTERARITSGGDFLVGTTSNSATSNAGSKFIADGRIFTVNTNTTNAQESLSMYSTGASAYRFYVGWGGTVFATNTTISAISDQRYKENIRDLDVGLDAVMQLRPRKFDWKEGKGQDIKDCRGFIAQEFEEVFPDLIDEWKDPAPENEEPYKSVRQDLIPVLVKAIQELKAELDTVKAELATLKGN